MWVLPMGCISSRTAPAQVLSTGCSPSGMDCSSVGPLWGHRSCQRTCSSVGLLSAGHSSCQESAPVWALHGLQLPSGLISLLWRGVLHRLQVDICSTMDLCGLQGNNLHHHGLRHRLQGNLCSRRCLKHLLPLGVCRVVSLTFSHSSLPDAAVQLFLPFLKYLITEVLPTSLIGSTLASVASTSELAGTGTV